MKRIAIVTVRFYQYFISPMLGPRCRFYPTCSQYAIEALTRFGLVKGCYLSFRRVIRCHPACAGGYDPVPEKTNVTVPPSNCCPESDPSEPKRDRCNHTH